MRLRALWSVANDLRPFYDEKAVEDWMDTNQLGRRNLTPDQRSIMRGRRYNRTKKAAGGRSGRTFGDAEVALPNTAAALAKAHGVCERTIKSDGKRAGNKTYKVAK